MSLKITGQKMLATSTNGTILANQARASVSLFFALDPLADPTKTTVSFLISRAFYNAAWIDLIGAGTTPGTVKLQFAWRNAATQVSQNVDLTPGAVYHLAMTYDQAAQIRYVNGEASQFGILVGNTSSAASAFRIGGWDSSPTNASVWRIGDVAIWNNYVLTPTDVANLRDGLLTPADIGGGATLRSEWTLEGTNGVIPAPGDAGLADAFGNAAYNLTSITGPGAVEYSSKLLWVPAAQIKEARVGTSGRTLFAFFRTIGSNLDTSPLAINTSPTVRINGTSVGQATNPLCSGKHSYVMWTMPTGVTASPSDVVTLDAPVNWVRTQAGATEAISGASTVNYAGRSCFGTESLTRTLKMGLNIEWYPTGENAIAPYGRNLAKTLSVGNGVATRDSSGKPLTLTGTQGQFRLYQYSEANYIDSTGYPGPTGLFAVGWDDLNGGTEWTITSGNGANTTVTPVTTLDNPGSGGVGKVKVYDVQRAVASTTSETSLLANLTHASGTPSYDNLVIYGPGEFAYTANTPTVLDKTDPYALSSGFLSRVAGAGSIRAWNHLIGGASSSMSEPEHMRKMTDFTWGWGASVVSRDLGYTSASPFSTSDTPYFYTPVMGSKYAATLASSINAATTTLTITDAATAPVMVGLRLYADSEIMRVTEVSGTTVTVQRGVANTTAASHAAGTIQVGYRVTMPPIGAGIFTNAAVFKLTTSTPHGIVSGHPMTFTGTGWPTMATTDARTVFPPNSGSPAFVTGPSTIVVKVGTSTGYSTPCVTLAGTTSLDSANQKSPIRVQDQAQIPYAMHGKAAVSAGVPDIFYAVPHMATDDLVYAIAREIRDSVPAGKTIWVELSNETWNFPVPNYFFSTLSASLYPGQNALVSYARRSSEVWAIFRSVFNESGAGRAGEIRGFLNFQTVTTTGSGVMTWAAAQSPPVRIDGLALAPYVYSTTTDDNWLDPITNAAFGSLEPDQAMDLWIHGQYHRTDSKGTVAFANAWNAIIANYNAATGNSCKLISYEGGIEEVFHPPMANYKERNRDLVYHPNYYIIEKDWYALMQRLGFQKFNIFAMSVNWNLTGRYVWGLYHHRQQEPGRGDGSDGKADNRLCLATPGYPNSKSATTNQDLANVSVRGQAWLDWNTSSVQTVSGSGGISYGGRAPYASTFSYATAGTGGMRLGGKSVEAFRVGVVIAGTGGVRFGARSTVLLTGSSDAYLTLTWLASPSAS